MLLELRHEENVIGFEEFVLETLLAAGCWLLARTCMERGARAREAGSEELARS
jgi:hypothetical protein